jgi:nitroreductase
MTGGRVDGEQAIEQALRAAVVAPSLFNSQPWRVRSLGGTVLICADRSRRLPVHDPHDRELLLACGSFTMYAQIALEAAGFACDVELLPGSSYAPDVVAAVQVRPSNPFGPVSDAHVHRLAAAMSRTVYDRSPFAAAAVDPAHLDVMRSAAEAEGAWLVVLDDDRRIEAAVLHTGADDMLRRDPEAIDEVKAWTRHGDSYDDGVPLHATDTHSDQRACSFPLRDFDTDLDHPVAHASDPPDVERPTIVLLCTAHDGLIDAVVAGRALGRVLLEAAAVGLATSPLNQALQVGTRWQLSAALSLIGVPQYLLRIGVPTSQPPRAHRRSLSDIRRPGGDRTSRSASTPPTQGKHCEHKENA